MVLCDVAASNNDNVKAKVQSHEGGALVPNKFATNAGSASVVPRVHQCPYSDVRLKQAGKVNSENSMKKVQEIVNEGLNGFCVQPCVSSGVSKTPWDDFEVASLRDKLGASAENVSSMPECVAPALSLPAWMKTSSFNKMAGMGATSFSFLASSAEKYAVKDANEGKISELFSASAAYHSFEAGDSFAACLRPCYLPAAIVAETSALRPGRTCLWRRRSIGSRTSMRKLKRRWRSSGEKGG